MNIPLAALALVATFRVLPEIRDPAKPRLPDWLGTVLLVAAVSLATAGLVQGPGWHWDARVIGCFAAALVLGAAFVARSTRHQSPVLELEILRVPAFALSSVSAALFYAAFSAMLLGNVLFLTGVWHYSVLRAGLALTPGPLAAAAVAPFAGKLVNRIGPGPVGGAGALPAFTIAAISTLPVQRLATGIGAQTMFRQIGATLGVAAFVALLGTPTAATVISAFNHGRWFMTGTAALAASTLAAVRRS